MRRELDATHLRVFLSADLVGSTRLKNRFNHQALLERFRARWHVIERLREQSTGSPVTDEQALAAVLESLGINTEDYDWAAVVRYFYEAVHSEFDRAIGEVANANCLELRDQKVEPWKAIGDELIYQFHVKGRRELHWLVRAFLMAVRRVDQKVRVTSRIQPAGLRIKGAAWVAGFPVRNRIVELPGIKLVDYLGPDIDTGFRIAKCTKAGMLVVSVELAELLSEGDGAFEPMLGKVVGWEELKGVWSDNRYPVVWIDFPRFERETQALAAHRFSVWEQEESVWCKQWESSTSKKLPLPEIVPEFRELRASLPATLGLVDPYIFGDPLEREMMPPDHVAITKLLAAIQEHQTKVAKQDASEPPPEPSRQADVEQDVSNATRLVSRPATEEPNQ